MPRRSPPWRRALQGVAAGVAVAATLVPMGPAAAVVAPPDLVVDIAFPAERGGRYGDDYTQPRSSGRTHCATDILGNKHSGVFAAVSGTISFMPTSKPSYGYMINLQGDDGRRYSYVHLDDDTPGTNDDAAGPGQAYAPGLAVGSRVARGQLIGFMGDSGNAKGTPHLHFEIHDPAYDHAPCATGGNTRINPYRSLRRAEGATVTTPATPVVTPPATGVAARPIQGACPSGRVPASGFSDVGPTHRAGVDCASWWRVVVGTSATTFAPGGTISRAQLATFVVNVAAASGSPLPATGTDHFDDDEGSVHEANIDRVAAAGIMGSANRSFSPGLAVSRGSMATVVAKSYRIAAGSPLPAGPDAFGDDAGASSEASINAIAQSGIAVGYADGSYRPSVTVSREQMATFFARLLDALVASGNATPPS